MMTAIPAVAGVAIEVPWRVFIVQCTEVELGRPAALVVHQPVQQCMGGW